MNFEHAAQTRAPKPTRYLLSQHTSVGGALEAIWRVMSKMGEEGAVFESMIMAKMASETGELAHDETEAWLQMAEQAIKAIPDPEDVVLGIPKRKVEQAIQDMRKKLQGGTVRPPLEYAIGRIMQGSSAPVTRNAIETAMSLDPGDIAPHRWLQVYEMSRTITTEEFRALEQKGYWRFLKGAIYAIAEGHFNEAQFHISSCRSVAPELDIMFLVVDLELESGLSQMERCWAEMHNQEIAEERKLELAQEMVDIQTETEALVSKNEGHPYITRILNEYPQRDLYVSFAQLVLRDQNDGSTVRTRLDRMLAELDEVRGQKARLELERATLLEVLAKRDQELELLQAQQQPTPQSSVPPETSLWKKLRSKK